MKTNNFAFQGVNGAYSEQAGKNVFPESKSFPCSTFEEMFACVRNNKADIALVSIENSKAGRVADFIELGHLMCVDALDRDESCGAHARLEYLAESGDAMRDDENFGYVAAWEYSDDKPVLHKEQLDFEFIKPTYRDYK